MKHYYSIPNALPEGEKERLLKLLIEAEAERDLKSGFYVTERPIEEFEQILAWEAHYYDQANG